jgi:lauroyl/myristoyl acyltransferase
MGLLLDQQHERRHSPCPFFGIEAMTPPAATLALRHGAVLVPAHIVRLDGARGPRSSSASRWTSPRPATAMPTCTGSWPR